MAAHSVFFWPRKACKSANPIPFAPINPQTSLSFAPEHDSMAKGIPDAIPTPAVAIADVLIKSLLLVIFYLVGIENKS
jgi:hypothetical protein